MIARVLVDTGPLVAILNANDSRHEECVVQLQDIIPPLLTCWPVITEAAWLLRDDWSALEQLLLSFNTGFLRLLSLDQSSMPWMTTFMRKYRKIQPQIADAALIHLAEREDLETLFTLDRRDFSVYRLLGRRALTILP